MKLNEYSGRSFNNLAQYPIFLGFYGIMKQINLISTMKVIFETWLYLLGLKKKG